MRYTHGQLSPEFPGRYCAFCASWISDSDWNEHQKNEKKRRDYNLEELAKARSAQAGAKIRAAIVEERIKEVQDTLQERNKTHGDFTINAKIAQEIKLTMRKGNWINLRNSMRESLELIATKIGRITNTTGEDPDHWHDIAGYAILIENELKGKK